jgi:hypothetical protein
VVAEIETLKSGHRPAFNFPALAASIGAEPESLRGVAVWGISRRARMSSCAIFLHIPHVQTGKRPTFNAVIAAR